MLFRSSGKVAPARGPSMTMSSVGTAEEAAGRCCCSCSRFSVSATRDARLGDCAVAKEAGLDIAAVAEMLHLDAMVRTATSFEEHFDPESGRQAVDLTDSIVLPEFAAEQNETRDMVVRVLDALPDAMRRVIRGIYLDDRMVKDLADEMEVSHAYVSKLRSRGLALMREAMEAWEQGTAGDRTSPAKAEFFGALFGPEKPASAHRSEDLLPAI